MLNYKQSGVDIDKADALTQMIRSTVKSENIGMFAGIYDHPQIPGFYLAACTDGVGTKVIPLIERGLIENIAIDLVAMNLNDLVCTGAVPLFFLDYFATGRLNLDVASNFINYLRETLAKYSCTLLGGETAELGDLISSGHFDVGGFAVGIVAKSALLKKESVKEGDCIIGLRSSGPHSNGYTLIRKLYEMGNLSETDMIEALNPTYIYVNEINQLCTRKLINVCAHITGGGLCDNLSRVIPEGLCADISRKNIPPQPIFQKLSSLIGEFEAFKTFNMGVGMCIVADPGKTNEIFNITQAFEPFILGRITKNEEGSRTRLG